jgi:mannose-6-phosphate isomerase
MAGRRVKTDARRVEKPWGWELVWAEGDRYAGKLLFVRAGQALSLQYHERKDESWYVQSGRAALELGPVGYELEEQEIGPGDTFHFAPGTVHRVRALEDTLIVEVSTPELDDVVRLADDYGRAGTSQP